MWILLACPPSATIHVADNMRQEHISLRHLGGQSNSIQHRLSLIVQIGDTVVEKGDGGLNKGAHKLRICRENLRCETRTTLGGV
jgi:hypothetical protein